MDPETREVFDRVLGYVEKKYVKWPHEIGERNYSPEEQCFQVKTITIGTRR